MISNMFNANLKFLIKRKQAKKIIGDRALAITEDNLAFFPEINTAYNRIKKSANTSVFLFFDDLVQKKVPENISAESRKKARSIRKVPFAQISMLSKCHSFTCVRNPYHRSISGFLDKVGSGYQKNYAEYRGYGDPTASSFLDFLKQIDDWGTERINPHFIPQSNLLFQPIEYFTKVAKVENLQLDMADFLEEIGKDPSHAAKLAQPHQLEKSIPNKITNSHARIDFLNSETKRMIEKIYAVDFENFSY